MIIEEWKTIESHIDYQISSFGRLRSNRTSTKNKILKQTKQSDGYAMISLRIDNCENRVKKYLIHRLVAQAFVLGKDCENYIVDHIDGNKDNNKSSNLRWVSPVINRMNRSGYILQLIEQICKLNNEGKTPEQIRDIIR